MAKHEPWKQPWWRPTRGDELFFAWFVLIHVGAVVGLILAPLPGWPVFLAAAGLHFLGGLGNMVGAFVASFITSEVISIGGVVWSTEMGYVIAFALFILIMFIRPGGIFARRQ